MFPTNIIPTKIPFCRNSILVNIDSIDYMYAGEVSYAADATNWLSFFLVSTATVPKEMVLFTSLSTAKLFAGEDGISWSTTSKMLLEGAYSMNSSESSSSTTDSKTLERTGNKWINRKDIILNSWITVGLIPWQVSGMVVF